MSTKNASYKITAKIKEPPKPKPPTLRVMIRSIADALISNVDAFKQMRDKLESVCTESGRLYNRFQDVESRREKELDNEMERTNAAREIWMYTSVLNQPWRRGHFAMTPRPSSMEASNAKRTKSR